MSDKLADVGEMYSSAPYMSWKLEASCKVSYSLDLWLHSFDGSVSAKFDTSLG